MKPRIQQSRRWQQKLLDSIFERASRVVQPIGSAAAGSSLTTLTLPSPRPFSSLRTKTLAFNRFHSHESKWISTWGYPAAHPNSLSLLRHQSLVLTSALIVWRLDISLAVRVVGFASSDTTILLFDYFDDLARFSPVPHLEWEGEREKEGECAPSRSPIFGRAEALAVFFICFYSYTLSCMIFMCTSLPVSVCLSMSAGWPRRRRRESQDCFLDSYERTCAKGQAGSSIFSFSTRLVECFICKHDIVSSISCTYSTEPFSDSSWFYQSVQRALSVY